LRIFFSVSHIGYGGTTVDSAIAKKFARKACQYGEFLGCVMYFYIREGKEIPLSIPVPQFSDIKSNQLYLQLRKKFDSEKIPFEDTAKRHVAQHFSLTTYRYTTHRRDDHATKKRARPSVSVSSEPVNTAVI
jgi:hypothetical protein